MVGKVCDVLYVSQALFSASVNYWKRIWESYVESFNGVVTVLPLHISRLKLHFVEVVEV